MCKESENRPEVSLAIGGPGKSNAAGANGEGDAEPSGGDELRAALAEHGRRHVLRCLAAAETPMALADLTDELVRRVGDASPTGVQDERERIYALLYHLHLPKLDDAGIVSFDPDRKLVDLREDATSIADDDFGTSDRDRPGDSP